MSIAMLLKIFSDCCVGFAILGSGPVAFAIPLLLPALICGVSAGIAAFFDGKGWNVPRRLCCVLPFACLLLADGLGQMLILAIPAGYTAWIILRGELALEYSSYRHFFVRSLWLLGAVCAVSYIWIFLTQITNEAVFRPDMSVILRYGLVHLLCGVVLQRQLRLGVGNRAEGGRRQLGMLLGTAAAIAVGFLTAEPLMRGALAAVLKMVLTLLLLPFAFLLDLLAKLFSKLQTEEDKETFGQFVDYLENLGLSSGGGAGLAPPPSDAPTTINTTWIWVALATVLLVVAAVLLLRSFRKRGEYAGSGDLQTRVITAPKKKRNTTFSNRTRVRQLYRDFLRSEKELGLRLRPNDTSADVLARIHPRTDVPSAAELRQVYLSARYDQRQQITRSQVEAAKQALKATRRAKNG